MSMISEQIQALRDLSAVYIGNGLPKVFAEAADTIEELSAKLADGNMDRSTAYYNNGWIPCSSGKMPNLCEPVLVTDALECVFKAMLLANGNWETEHFILEGNYITAWQPLPKPYKGE